MTTTIFLFSFLAMALLVSSKLTEIKTGRAHFVSSTIRKGDEKIHDVSHILVLKYMRYKKISQIFIFEFLPSYTYEILTKLKDYVSKKYYSAGEGIRGRRVLRTNGSVSFFLERLADDKVRADEGNF